jgi:cytochrome c oxidase assembly protein subunit 15
VAAAARAQAAGAVALRRRVLPLAALVGVTAVSGAFVAGLDAGHAYNTFPLMNGQLVPDEYWALPGLRNAFENTAAVQLHHRALALTTLAGVAASWAGARRLPLPAPARAALNATALLTAAQVRARTVRRRLCMACMLTRTCTSPCCCRHVSCTHCAHCTHACRTQVSLGITTLLTYVPVSLGAAHQAGALALFTGVLTLMHTLRPASPSAAALAVSRLAPPVAVLATAAIAAAVTQTE